MKTLLMAAFVLSTITAFTQQENPFAITGSI